MDKIHEKIDVYEERIGGYLSTNKEKIGSYVTLAGAIVLVGLALYDYLKKRKEDKEEETQEEDKK